MLVAIDEFSRFPFAFPCRDVTAKTVISCLTELFCTFGVPGYVHSDRGSAFMSTELRKFLLSRNVATSRTTPYHPEGNSQCERLNFTLWKTVKLMLRTRNLREELWDQVLPEALHSVRSLLCTATNQTPHERFLSFERRSMLGRSLPPWLLTPGPVLVRRFVRNKGDPLVDEAELLSANPHFSHIRYADGRETSVSTGDLAPCPATQQENVQQSPNENGDDSLEKNLTERGVTDIRGSDLPVRETVTVVPDLDELGEPSVNPSCSDSRELSTQRPSDGGTIRKSSRVRRPPRRWPDDEWTE